MTITPIVRPSSFLLRSAASMPTLNSTPSRTVALKRRRNIPTIKGRGAYSVLKPAVPYWYLMMGTLG